MDATWTQLSYRLSAARIPLYVIDYLEHNAVILRFSRKMTCMKRCWHQNSDSSLGQIVDKTHKPALSLSRAKPGPIHSVNKPIVLRGFQSISFRKVKQQKHSSEEVYQKWSIVQSSEMCEGWRITRRSLTCERNSATCGPQPCRAPQNDPETLGRKYVLSEWFRGARTTFHTPHRT